eukprot:TRINITY_DN261_c0_g5_i1.p1 TRINITY_DN261_c0_g5~~TRINITY_DN261_c0_g5_i1.p1  ORF type:complete len:343 (+),score=93.48 TRINITY_DN261_c0_g5_i1:3-1031(+)
MKLLIVSLLVALAISLPTDHEEMFLKFVEKHGRVYGSNYEILRRREVFSQNVYTAEKLGMLNPEAEFSAVDSPFGDLTAEEFQTQVLGHDIDSASVYRSCLAEGVTMPAQPETFPTNFDWRQHEGIINPIKNQGSCGSCWAFSTAFTIETMLNIHTDKSFDLSRQQIVDCSKGGSNVFYHGKNITVYNDGCGGGWPWSAMGDIASSGIASTEDYPYHGKEGTCESHTAVAQIGGYQCLPNNEDQIASFVANNNPISIAINANTLQFYIGGIFNNPLCSKTQVNHAINIVGYGEEEVLGHNVKFWIIANSWGKTWGQKGYFKMIRGHNMCGVANAASAPLMPK